MTTSAAPASTPVRAGFALKVAYALGQGGNVLTYQLISTFVLTLYLPTAGKGTPLMPDMLLAVGGFSGIATYIVLSVIARAVDTPFDPWLANKSDKSRHPFGRRRIFMAASVFPLSLSTALIFLPPIDHLSLWNAAYLGAMLTIYFCLFSTYVAPYLALLPEIAPDKKENTVVSTMMAVFALLGGLISTIVAPMVFLHDTDTDRGPLRLMGAALAAVAFVMMLVPVLVIKEPPPPPTTEEDHGLWAAIRSTFRHKPFVPYVLGTNLFFFGFTVLQTAVPFYVEVLLNKPLSEVPSVMIPLFGASAVAFPGVAVLANKFGKRRVMIGASVGLALLMGIGIPLLPSMPSLALPLFALAGIPVSCFLAVPNSMLADVCDADANTSGRRREAMFFGAQGFLQKIALGVAGGLFIWIASLFGRTADHPLGVQLSGPLCAIALLGAGVCFWRYPETEVQASMRGRQGG